MHLAEFKQNISSFSPYSVYASTVHRYQMMSSCSLHYVMRKYYVIDSPNLLMVFMKVFNCFYLVSMLFNVAAMLKWSKTNCSHHLLTNTPQLWVFRWLILINIVFTNNHSVYIYRFPVAEWLAHSTTTLEVTGSRPSFGDILRFVSRIDTVSDTERLKMVCVTFQEFNVTWNFSGDNG